MNVILLIDDEPGLASLVEMTFGDDRAVRVDWAPDYRSGLESARRQRPDLVLLDLSLERQDGLDLLPRLRAEPELSEVPFIIFSVHDSRRDEAMIQGADGFLGKPFNEAQLQSAVRPFLV